MGTLYVVSTPIGNLEDITLRAIKTLSSVEAVLCEDTRRTGLLLAHIKISKPLIRFDDASELQKIPEIIHMLESGNNLALVSDAGTPLINDPGFLLVRECRRRNIPVVSIPGASALLTALTSSGLPANTFTYLGYPPEKQGHRIKLFENLLKINRLIYSTYIFYCAPHKLEQTLADMKVVFGDIEITIARELTKVHEEIWQGALSQWKITEVKGELVILFQLLP